MRLIPPQVNFNIRSELPPRPTFGIAGISPGHLEAAIRIDLFCYAAADATHPPLWFIAALPTLRHRAAVCSRRSGRSYLAQGRSERQAFRQYRCLRTHHWAGVLLCPRRKPAQLGYRRSWERGEPEER